MKFLKTISQQVDLALDGYLPKANAFPARLNKAMRYSTFAGGKRLRPILCLLTGDMLGIDAKDIMPAACAIEMIHTYSLIHDDLPAMDDDDLRRGKPTLHKAFDEATAILAGDGLQSLAFQTIANHSLDDSHTAQDVLALCKASGVQGMVAGQMADMQGRASHSLAQVKTIHRNKTAAMIRVCFEIPAIHAALPKQQSKELAQAGKMLGLAFQIADDLLDIQSNAKTLGKTQGKDVDQNKATYPAVLGAKRAKREADKLIKQSIQVLQSHGPKSKRLCELAQYIIERKK